MSSNANINVGGKIQNSTSYIKRFANSLNYPIRNAVLPIFAKAIAPYPSLGMINIKSFNNFDSTSQISSLTSTP
jgi:hypothetical protein